MSVTPERSGAGGLAIASFVFGLASIPLALLPYGLFVGPVAVVLGLLARTRSHLPAGRLRFARTGTLFGAVGTIIWLITYGLLALIAS